MDIYAQYRVGDLLAPKTYPGRGIITGLAPDGKTAIHAYFIMGRSANSRNRYFQQTADGLYTRPADASQVEDPSLIIYRALGQYGDQLVVSNGDQTDTLLEGLAQGLPWQEALDQRTFEPDPPNFTPRISSLSQMDPDHFSYSLSILKSLDPEGHGKSFQTFTYPGQAGLGHFISTYEDDGNPLPSFQGEPRRLALDGDLDSFSQELWEALNPDNRISLYLRFTDLTSGRVEDRIINKYQAV